MRRQLIHREREFLNFNIMHSIIIKTTLVSIVLTLLEAEELIIQTCPKPQEIFPCICSVFNMNFDVVCSSLDDGNFGGIIPKFRGFHIRNFKIRHSNLKIIPPNAFNNFSVDIFHIEKSEVQHFFIFQGLQGIEYSLHSIIFTELKVKYWRLSHRVEFVYLDKFIMSDCPDHWRNESVIINYLPEQLNFIEFEKCRVRSQEEPSFQRFPYLESLSLANNLLNYVKRNYFPQPARLLHFLSLSDNPITSLSHDAFEDMPALRNLWLQNTLLNTVDYDVFKPVLSQLKVLHLWNIPLNCTCESAWLLDVKEVWEQSIITCISPEILKNCLLVLLEKNALCSSSLQQLKNITSHPFFKPNILLNDTV